ncbi:response regulator transcription factor [Saccharothrix longispora]|uniref:response regulator transcription factor n=1 Tax=Saccharothrix longispora TaxID=33920 RepID=UPI0028FD481F|nr:response regulator transcription factor [Saccharothrix longispora]MBY8847707.1 response regulator transcription factor [Saccharothrix sp. MB29]MDU0292915.1 response regulator transcription factor [Saccharothrix longispora]
MRILVVEDDDRVARGLLTALKHAGYEVHRVGTAAAALTAPAADVVLLDLGLPDGDGLDVLRELRRRPGTAIITVTARGEERERVLGLRLGADDYVVKPFGTAELLARVEAVLRRTRAARAAEREHRGHEVVLGPLTLDPASREARVDGVPVPLTRKEFDLLALLVGRAGTVVSRDLIVDQVWQAHWEAPSRTLDTHIAALRGKLGDAVRIETIRGVGYRAAATHTP